MATEMILETKVSEGFSLRSQWILLGHDHVFAVPKGRVLSVREVDRMNRE